MSVSSEAAVLVGSPGGRDGRRAADRAAADRAARAQAQDRPRVRLLAFGALAFYGVLRWGTLMKPASFWRLMGLLALAVALAWAGSLIRAHRRPAIAVLTVLTLLLAFALCGVPFAWVRHLRISLTADGISQGLSALPRVLVPYLGINPWIRTVILLGAAVLLLTSAVIVASAPRGRLGDGRRVAAIVPLIALAIVPATLVRPSVAYFHGLLLFLLVAAFLWGDRVRSGDGVMAVALAVLAGAAAMIAAPGLDGHKPWLDYEALAGKLGPAHIESFNWSQGYGPLRWPRDEREVLDVQAKRPDYWKTENLDEFTGRGWAFVTPQNGDPTNTIDPATVRRWTQTLHVTFRAMKSTAVVAAGVADAPTHVSGTVEGFSDGTWADPPGLGPGDSYDISTYDPHPSAAQLRSAGEDYPDVLAQNYLLLDLPIGDPPRPSNSSNSGLPQPATAPALFPPYGRQVTITGATLINPRSFLVHSPYAPAVTLVRQLSRTTTTAYDYVMNVKRYLDSGHYRYDENPPVSRYPLLSFLFKTKRGYCQQFAGAMALLLRMGGVPARVATGFTTGTFDKATGSYVVTDLDAHAWVEAWFPHYGWVRFDPTPAAAPARGGHISLAPIKNPGTGGSSSAPSTHGLGPSSSTTTAAGHGHGGGFPVALVVLIVVLAGLAAAAVALTVRLREPTEDELLTELERAFARSGRSVPAGTTLVELERRLRDSPGAQDYVRRLRLARFAGGSEMPSREQRRALRRQLRAGLGLGGRARAAWALPPRITLRIPGRSAATGQ
jgi:protein-glutamine gamma-glutamyltransferase